MQTASPSGDVCVEPPVKTLRKGYVVSMKSVLSAGLLVAVIGVTPLVGTAGQPAPATDTSKLGPQVGAVVPAFSGTDQFGQAQSLASLSGPKGLMLVFSRSADW